MAASRTESLEDSDRQLAKLFEQAKEDFEHETHKKLGVLGRFDTVDDFIEQIRKEKAAFGSFREHEHPNLFRHIRNALKPIQILAKLFSGPSGNVSEIYPSTVHKGLFNLPSPEHFEVRRQDHQNPIQIPSPVLA